MRISIQNFKSIRLLNEFNIKPLTILSGTNSTGKSSFIQFLLLLKQTIELDSSNYQLVLNGDQYEVKEYLDVVYGKSFKNSLKAEFIFDKVELMELDTRIQFFDSFDYKCKVAFVYAQNNGKPYISDFIVTYLVDEDQKKEGQFVKFSSLQGSQESYSIETNNELFVKGIWNSNTLVNKINFSSIFPSSYDFKEINTVEGPKGEKLTDAKTARYFPNLDSIKDKINIFFKTISYIGPLRKAPKDLYSIRGRHFNVGVEGEFVAEVLENFKDEKIEFYRPEIKDDGISFAVEESTLLKSVSFWMCDIFQLGKEIKSIKSEDNYSIIIVNNSGLSTTVKHVGFGISQILPIIVEGLNLKKGSTLILEQPEIHLHPKLQSLLFDFLQSIMLKGVFIIIETHSDHFITRMRRRLAENNLHNNAANINLTFIENVKENILFRSIALDDSGTLEYFPKDFMEQSNVEMKAILKAQIRKTK